LSTLEELGLIIGVGLVVPAVLLYIIMTVPKFMNTFDGIGHVVIQTLAYAAFFFMVGWPYVFFNKWNDGQYDDWGFLIGMLFIAVPAAAICKLLYWTEKGSEANRIATYLHLEVHAFINKEWEDVGGKYDDVFPLENSNFRVIHTNKGVSWYSKEYDVWFLQDRFTYFCDSNQNILGHIKTQNYDFNLKKHLIEERELQFYKKYDSDPD